MELKTCINLEEETGYWHSKNAPELPRRWYDFKLCIEERKKKEKMNEEKKICIKGILKENYNK